LSNAISDALSKISFSQSPVVVCVI